MQTPSSEELMLGVRDGDLEAFEQLVLRHQAEAWRVAYRYTGDPAEAEDLAQNAFLKVLAAAPRYKPTATFRTWFFRNLTRLCIDHGRKKRPILLEVLPNPAQQASQAECAIRIQTALNALPADYRMGVSKSRAEKIVCAIREFGTAKLSA
ncbi:MAG: sigma-70 family RNA polymerase sigma factor [Nitrospirales bacterium]